MATVLMRRMRTRLIVAFGVGLVLTSCDTGPVLEVDVLSAFTWEPTDHWDFESQSSPRAIVETAVEAVHVRGQAFDPCYGWNLVASGSRTGDTLVLEVDWPEANLCLDLTRGFVYEAVLSPLEAAEYRVCVRQRVLVREPWGYPYATILDTTVRVLP